MPRRDQLDQSKFGTMSQQYREPRNPSRFSTVTPQLEESRNPSRFATVTPQLEERRNPSQIATVAQEFEEPHSYYVCCYGRSIAYYMIQIIGLMVGALGMILTLAVTVMPQWRVSIIVESSPNSVGQRVDGQWMSRWDGLWTTCLTQSNIPMQCTDYGSMVSLTTDLKAGRVLMSFAIVLTIIAFIFGLVGMLFNRCFGQNERGRNCFLLTSGIGFLLAGVIVAVIIGWTSFNIIRNANNPVCVGAQRQELGEAIFLGWPTIFFLFLSGIILCWINPCRDTSRLGDYSLPPSQPATIYELAPMTSRAEIDRPEDSYARSQYL